MSVALFRSLASPLAGGEARRWEDEIVYVVIIEEFFDGDPTNDVMRGRFFKERERYEGGFWGGDLKGVIAKLDDLKDLGFTTLLLYPVMQNDDSPVGKFLPTGYRPKDYENVDKNFGDNATLRQLVDAAHAETCVSFSTCLSRCRGSSTRSWSIPRSAIGSPPRPSTVPAAGRSRIPKLQTILSASASAGRSGPIAMAFASIRLICNRLLSGNDSFLS